MRDWSKVICSSPELPASALKQLQEVGFVVIPGPVPRIRLALLAAAYDSAVASAGSEDVGIGSTTTRVHDFVNRGAQFDELYVYPPLLEACYRVIGRPFKLGSMLARTVRPRSPAQPLHVDCERAAEGWGMVGFIFMSVRHASVICQT